ncbi:hypothetical protein LCGC14_0412590 [marine sediment metagenome]|uniref:Uncharacterized protein n=1 Tax=marine sediment metagenome TaxID=412755 RepID=A0A0F9W2P9_9ZZZZ
MSKREGQLEYEAEIAEAKSNCAVRKLKEAQKDLEEAKALVDKRLKELNELRKVEDKAWDRADPRTPASIDA